MTNAHAREKKTCARRRRRRRAGARRWRRARTRAVWRGGPRADALGQGAPGRSARLELGSPVTCLAAPGPRLAVAGTQNFAEGCGAAPPEDDELDAPSTGKKNENASESSSSSSNVLQKYALRRPRSEESSYASFDAFTRRVPMNERAATSPAAKPRAVRVGERHRKTRLGGRGTARNWRRSGRRQRKRRRDRNGKKTRLARNSARWTARRGSQPGRARHGGRRAPCSTRRASCR